MFVICWLLHPDPCWRATIADLEENRWINQPVDITKYSFDYVLGQYAWELVELVKSDFQNQFSSLVDQVKVGASVSLPKR